MSEMPPEGAPAAGGFMSRKFLGIPAIVWLLGAALLAFLYFRRSASSTGTGATSTGGGGTSTTGDITISPSPASPVTINAQYGPNTTTQTSGSPPRHRTPNPQPRPKSRPPAVAHVTTTPTTRYSAVYHKTLTAQQWHILHLKHLQHLASK